MIWSLGKVHVYIHVNLYFKYLLWSLIQCSWSIINKRKQPTKVKKLDKDKLWRMDIKVKKWIKIKFGKLRK